VRDNQVEVQSRPIENNSPERAHSRFPLFRDPEELLTSHDRNTNKTSGAQLHEKASQNWKQKRPSPNSEEAKTSARQDRAGKELSRCRFVFLDHWRVLTIDQSIFLDVPLAVGFEPFDVFLHPIRSVQISSFEGSKILSHLLFTVR
jgi:hypothetical protein